MTVRNYNEIIAKARAGEKPPALLDDRMFQVCAQISMHDRARSGASQGGSTRICWVPSSSASMQNPQAMRQRRETVEHRSGTMKAGMGATHFLTRTLTKVQPRWRSQFSPTIRRAS